MTTWVKYRVLFSSLLALSCLCTFLAARAWTTNAFGYYLFSYDQLDEIWGEVYEDATSEEWPGISVWLNSLPEASLIFRNPHPHLAGKYEITRTFNTSDGVNFVSLDSQRNFLMGQNGTLVPLDSSIPTADMYAVADPLNMVDDAVDALWNIPGTTTNYYFPLAVRYAPLLGASAHTRVSLSAPSFIGFDIECKTVPFAWSGYWAGWAINVNEFIDNGVNESIFGNSLFVEERNLAWLTTNRSIFGAFSNINLRVSHSWKGIKP